MTNFTEKNCLGTENCDAVLFLFSLYFQISPAYWKKYVLRVLFAWLDYFGQQSAKVS